MKTHRTETDRDLVGYRRGDCAAYDYVPERHRIATVDGPKDKVRLAHQLVVWRKIQEGKLDAVSAAAWRRNNAQVAKMFDRNGGQLP